METPLLGQLLDALGPALLRPPAARGDAAVPVSGTVVYERRAPLPPARDAVLLAVGVAAAGGEAADLVRRAAAAGYAGVVVKSFGDPTDALEAAADRAGIALLAADEAVGWHHLDAMITSALATTARSADTASPAVGDLFALANAIAGMVGGATAIEDPSRRILAYSTLPGQVVDEGRRQGILGLQVPEGPGYDEQYGALAQAEGVYRFPTSPSGMARLCVAVRAGGEPLGSIWVVDPENALDAAAERALLDAADIAALHLLAARTAADVARRHRADLLRRLLTTPGSVSVVAPQLGLAADAPVAVAAFLAASGDPDGVAAAHTAARLADLVGLHCEAHYGRHGCALIDGTVYALLPAGPAGNAHRELVADIARRAHGALRVRVHAGIGSLVDGLRSAASSREDADLVLRALADRAADPGPCLVASIDEVRASATLAALTQTLSGHGRMTQGLGPAIRAHDVAHGTDYVRTLLAYLDANSDIPTASGSLGVHPNTVRYRISRAEDVFGFDLADPDERLVLWLQLRLRAAP